MGAAIAEKPSHFLVPSLLSQVQRRVTSCVSRLDVGPLRNQQPSRCLIPNGGGQVQRRPLVPVHRRDIGSALDEQPHYRLRKAR